jgi:hypothetical protein
MFKTVVIRMTPELYEKASKIKENRTWVQVMEDWVKKDE